MYTCIITYYIVTTIDPKHHQRLVDENEILEFVRIHPRAERRRLQAGGSCSPARDLKLDVWKGSDVARLVVDERLVPVPEALRERAVGHIGRPIQVAVVQRHRSALVAWREKVVRVGMVGRAVVADAVLCVRTNIPEQRSPDAREFVRITEVLTKRPGSSVLAVV